MSAEQTYRIELTLRYEDESGVRRWRHEVEVRATSLGEACAIVRRRSALGTSLPYRHPAKHAQRPQETPGGAGGAE